MTAPPVFRFPFEAMASSCEIVLAGLPEIAAATLARAAVAEVKRIEVKYSRYRPDSVVSRINAAAGKEWFDCDAETAALLDYAGKLYETSGGLFDATSGILRRAWDFKQAVVPAPDSLAPLLALIDWRRVERAGNRVRLAQAGMELDFGGFGKEYATDCAADLLLAQGALHGYVNLAGDMRILGPKPDGEAWTIGIQDPRRKDAVVAGIPIERGALATSGDYERYFERDGRRYCHVLDPRSGMPVTYWRSVSVLAPRAIVAGSCSTIAMLKQAAGIEFLEQAGMNYFTVDHAGKLQHSEQLN
jgi:thiamine biosynthesis lipoprotein